jgi:ATP-dependent Clp protease ATP-binding subunit ClpA
MPKINVYLPDDLAAAVRDAQVPVSAVCQRALERAVRDVGSLRATHEPPPEDKPARGMFGRFTPRARTVVSRAEAAAREMEHDHVGTEHVLLGLVADPEGVAGRVLAARGVTIDAIRGPLSRGDDAATTDAEALAAIGIDLDEVVRRIDRHLGGPGRTRRPRFARASKKTLELSLREALALRHHYIGTEHLLLGLARSDDRVVADTLAACGVERSALRAVVAEMVRQTG